MHSCYTHSPLFAQEPHSCNLNFRSNYRLISQTVYSPFSHMFIFSHHFILIYSFGVHIIWSCYFLLLYEHQQSSFILSFLALILDSSPLPYHKFHSHTSASESADFHATFSHILGSVPFRSQTLWLMEIWLESCRGRVSPLFTRQSHCFAFNANYLKCPAF